MNSIQKGKAGERELANKLKEYGYKTRRGQQFNGLEGEDVVGLDYIHIECKRVENLNIDKALEQSIRDSNKDQLPAVFHRKNRTQWKVTMLLEDWIKLYEQYLVAQDFINHKKGEKDE